MEIGTQICYTIFFIAAMNDKPKLKPTRDTKENIFCRFFVFLQTIKT